MQKATYGRSHSIRSATASQVGNGDVIRRDVIRWKISRGLQQEASDAQLFRDIHAAIEFYANLMTGTKDGYYDEHWEPICNALVTDNGEERLLHKIEGFKDPA